MQSHVLEKLYNPNNPIFIYWEGDPIRERSIINGTLCEGDSV